MNYLIYFNNYYKTMIIKTVDLGIKVDKQINKIVMKMSIYVQFLTQVPNQVSRERKVYFFRNTILEKLEK